MGIFDKLAASNRQRKESNQPDYSKEQDKQHSLPGASALGHASTRQQANNYKVKISSISSKPMDLGIDDAIVTAPAGVAPDQQQPTKPTTDDCIVQVNADGSYLVLDRQGEVVRTCDAIGVKREFSRDKFSKQLLVKRFGKWTRPALVKLSRSGTLSYFNDGVDVIEFLNGVHIHYNRETRTKIISCHVQKREIVCSPDGEISQRETRPDGERFRIWKNGKCVSDSETFYTSRRHQAATPNGAQPLVYVCREERHWLDDGTMQEKFVFRNTLNNDRHVTLSLQLSTGLLMLKGVVSVTSSFKRSAISDTVYEFKQPTSLRVDLPSYRGLLEGITQLRLFTAGENVGLSFKESSGKEYAVITAKPNGPATHEKAPQPESQVTNTIATGQTAAQLPLR